MFRLINLCFFTYRNEGGDKMFVNVSNHPSELWLDDQKKSAMQYGEVVDLAFPLIYKGYDSIKYDELVESYYERIMDLCPDVVMVQGEFVFTHRLVNTLKKSGVKVVAARSERSSLEYKDENGVIHKQSTFEFIDFVEY